MSNSIAPGSSADVNVKVTALTTNPNVPVTYKTIILKKNLVNGVNTLTQEMMSAINTKYVIKYDYYYNITFFKGYRGLPVAIHAFANCERSSNLRKRVLRSHTPRA